MDVEDCKSIFCASDKAVVVDKEEGRRGDVCFSEGVLPCVGCVDVCEIEGVGQTDGQVWLGGQKQSSGRIGDIEGRVEGERAEF